MNIKEDLFDFLGLNKVIELNEFFATRISGYSESLCSTDTYQFDDYSKYVADMYDPKEKAKRREKVFPEDSKKAFEMGVRFVKKHKTLERQK
jgi:hypothetical protein